LKQYYSDKRTLNILNVINILLFICIIIGLIYKMYSIKELFRVTELIVEIVVFTLITAYAILAFVMLPIWYRSLCYCVSSEEIIIYSGVIVKRTTYIKTDLIQYTTVVKSPACFGANFNFLLMNVCGKRLVMKFLSLQDMEEINKIIQSKLESKGSL